MITFFIIVCVIGYGLNKMMQFIKNNPGQSMDTAQLLKRLFGK